MKRLLLLVLMTGALIQSYPLDGAGSTGIRRLTGYRLVHEGKIKGAVKLPPGWERLELVGPRKVIERIRRQFDEEMARLGAAA